MNILLVEDDEGISQITTYILEENGHTVFRSSTQEEIEQAIGAKKVDFILMDVSLSAGNGGKISKNLKKNTEHKKIPIVLMSAHQNLKELAKKSDADGYLAKPFDIEDLLGTLARFSK